MMRVLLVSIGSLGDTLPSIAWAKELESRGHEVILGVNGYYQPLLDRENVRYESLWSKEEHLKMLQSTQLWRKSTSLDAHKEFFSVLLSRVYDFILKNHLPHETVVAAQTVLAGARLAQETHGIPLASLHLQPLFLRSIHDATGPVEHWPLWLRGGLDRLVDAVIDRWIGTPLNDFRKRIGLNPIRRAMKSWCNSPELVINFFPDWFNPPQPDWPANTHCVGFPFFRSHKVDFDRKEVEDFLSAGDPPIVFSVSSFTTDARSYFESSITAARELGKRAVFLTPYSEQIPDSLPPTIRYFEFVPLDILLPRAAIHVHHCGSGTVALTFDAGIPHIAVPQGTDQTDIAARLERLGVSRTISPKKYTAASVAKACRELLESPSVKARCAELAEKSHQQDALCQASELLERLVPGPSRESRFLAGDRTQVAVENEVLTNRSSRFMSKRPEKRPRAPLRPSRSDSCSDHHPIAANASKSKRTAGELAVFGAAPLFVETRMVGRPNLPCFDDFAELAREIFENRWLSNRGPMVQRFEEQIARISDVKHCVAVANATLGLQLLARALDIVDQVIVPAFTFVATAHAFRWQNATPVFADVLLNTHQIDPDCVQSLINDRTQAIVGVHLWGEACDVSRLEAIANRHSLPLIFDAAHAFGCSHRSRPIGGHGVAEVFSFHATKFINTFEGGAICTNDDALAQKLRAMVNFGFGASDSAVCLGMNAKMSEVSAAMGLANLGMMNQLVTHNRRIHDIYRSVLKRQQHIRMYPFDLSEERNLQYAVFEMVEDDDSLTRDELLKALAAENIIARRYFSPGLHRHQPYLEEQDELPSLPITEHLSRRVFLLPTGSAVSEEDAGAIAEIVGLILDNADIVREQLRSRESEVASVH